MGLAPPSRARHSRPAIPLAPAREDRARSAHPHTHPAGPGPEQPSHRSCRASCCTRCHPIADHGRRSLTCLRLAYSSRAGRCRSLQPHMHLPDAGVAQWQSNRLVSDRSRVQSPPPAQTQSQQGKPLPTAKRAAGGSFPTSRPRQRASSVSASPSPSRQPPRRQAVWACAVVSSAPCPASSESLSRVIESRISFSASRRSTQDAPSTDLPGSRSL